MKLNPLPQFEEVSNPLQSQEFSNGNKIEHATESSQSPPESRSANVTNSNSHDHGHGSNDIPEYDPNIQLTGYEKILEDIFHIRRRRSTIKTEIQTGIVQFISCLYILPVVPQQMARANYDRIPTIVATSAACCIGCILASFLTNLPLIIAPPTSVSIFLAVYMQQHNMVKWEGNAAVAVSGAVIILIGYRPLGRLVAKLIPGCIQAATSVGIGLITALAGATEISLVIHGQYTILDMGEITPEVIIAMLCLVLIGVLLHYHVKGAFCIALIVGSIVFWGVSKEWPEEVAEGPYVEDGNLSGQDLTRDSCLLFFNMIFLYILTLNGLARSLSDLAELTLPDGSIPNGRWLFIVCGFTTMISGFMSGPPILISPESAAGIHAGAKTGLSTLVCGLFFGLACFFSPLFGAVPGAGTSPLLLAVGVVLFGNVRRIDWSVISVAVPSFCALFFIPFTYSILRGIAFGYVTYILMGMATGTLYLQMRDMWNFYKVSLPTIEDLRSLTIRGVIKHVIEGMEINDKDQETAFEDLVAEAQQSKDEGEGDLPPTSPVGRRVSISRDRAPSLTRRASVSSGEGGMRRQASLRQDALGGRTFMGEGANMI